MTLTSTLIALALTFGCKGGDDDADDTGSGPVDADGDGFTVDEDCDDDDPTINPDAVEIRDTIDNDCDELVDDADDDWDTSTGVTSYLDGDGDTFGAGDAAVSCEIPAGSAAADGDCDDADAGQYPGADEYCNGEDDDCDTEVDEDDALDVSPWFADTDTDTFGDPDNVYLACEPPFGFVADNTDCDDTVTAVNPDATEVCNDVGDDCDGDIDGGAVDASSSYADTDGDGFGDPASRTIACDAPTEFVSDANDCDDTDGDINPDADETCDGVDNDCDSGTSEDGTVAWTASDGSVTDLTADLTGTSTAPATYSFTSDGELLFCDGTFYVNLDINADVSIDSFSGAADAVLLDGAATDTVIDVRALAWLWTSPTSPCRTATATWTQSS